MQQKIKLIAAPRLFRVEKSCLIVSCTAVCLIWVLVSNYKIEKIKTHWSVSQTPKHTCTTQQSLPPTFQLSPSEQSPWGCVQCVRCWGWIQHRSEAEAKRRMGPGPEPVIIWKSTYTKHWYEHIYITLLHSQVFIFLIVTTTYCTSKTEHCPMHIGRQVCSESKGWIIAICQQLVY